MKIRDLLNESQPGVAEGHADQQRKIFKKNGKPVGEVGIDRESSPGVGQWYMKCYAYDIDNSGYDSYEEAVAELKHCLKQGVAEGSEQNLVYISKSKVREFEEWMESEGLETEVPKKDVGKFIVYDYSGQDVITKSYADDWNEKPEQGVAEEQLAELSPQTLASYKKKAGAQASELDKRAFHKDTEPEQAKRDIAKANKRFSGIMRATRKEFGR